MALSDQCTPIQKREAGRKRVGWSDGGQEGGYGKEGGGEDVKGGME